MTSLTFVLALLVAPSAWSCSWPSLLISPEGDKVCEQKLIAQFKDPQDRIEVARYFRQRSKTADFELTLYDDAGRLSHNGTVVAEWIVLSAERGFYVFNGRLVRADLKDRSLIRRFRKMVAGSSKQVAGDWLSNLIGADEAWADNGSMWPVFIGWGIQLGDQESRQQDDMREREKLRREKIRKQAQEDENLAARREGDFANDLPAGEGEGGFLAWLFGKSTVRCQADGSGIVEGLTEFKQKKLILRPVIKDSSEIEIRGLGEKILRMKQDLRIPGGEAPCETFFTSAMKFSCDAAWVEFRNLHPNEAKNHEGNFAAPKCSYFDRKEKECQRFMREKFKDQLSRALKKSKKTKPAEFSTCGDASCSVKTPAKLEDLADGLGKDGGAAELERLLQSKGLGVAALGRCCGNERCRAEINELRPSGVQLQPSSGAAPGAAKK